MSTPTAITDHGRPELPPEAIPDCKQLVTEDDTPVDNYFSEKQQSFLKECLRASWPGPGENRPYIAVANVALYYTERQDPLVPDFMLSLDATVADDYWQKGNRCYVIWIVGKPPELVVEIVSNREGGEATTKLKAYARIGIPYYAIFDPQQLLSKEMLRVFGLHEGEYEVIAPAWLPRIGLGLCKWPGKVEDMEGTWLRWCDRKGNLLPSKEESKEQERQRADKEHQRFQQAEQRAQNLAEKLRQFGVDPDKI